MSEEQSESKLKVGEHVVWPGQGLGRIESIERQGGEEMIGLVILRSGVRIGVAAKNADKAIRRPIGHEAATSVLTQLNRKGDPDPRSWDDRHFDYARSLAKGTLQEQVQHLHKMYRSPYKPTFGEIRMLDVYECLILDELGHVLSQPADDLRAQMRLVHPVFAEGASPRPPEPESLEAEPAGPAIKGYELLGTFEVEEGIVVADPIRVSTRADAELGLNVRLGARSGKWYGYALEDEDTGRIGVLIAVHSSKIPRLAERSDLTELGTKAAAVASVRVDSGQMAILDQKVRNDERYEDEMLFRTGFGTVLDRGCTSESGFGDGTYPVSVVKDGDQAVYVDVDFRDDE